MQEKDKAREWKRPKRIGGGGGGKGGVIADYSFNGAQVLCLVPHSSEKYFSAFFI